MKKVAILHYASPPTVGGVEETIAYHARGLADLGYAVRVVTGRGESFDSRVETCVNPLFGSLDARVLKVKSQLDAGQVSSNYHTLLSDVREGLLAAFDGINCCIAHNIATLNKNLPLSAALASLAQNQQIKWITWCHDLAWKNPEYLKELHDGQPWDLLRKVWPNTRYVTVSEDRRGQLADMLGIGPERIAVILPGVDPARFFHWTAETRALVTRSGLLDADGLFLLPARLIRRKNVELALRILAEIRKQSGRDFRLIVSGPPGPHNPANTGYLQELLAL
ncbi:MAG TPA: glycosyltransferase family 4 protein, partial [Aggregatilineales bacterium]|nr:glycosyltransferase family 4 protein [Aggregatilineales bacterium]